MGGLDTLKTVSYLSRRTRSRRSRFTSCACRRRCNSVLRPKFRIRASLQRCRKAVESRPPLGAAGREGFFRDSRSAFCGRKKGARLSAPKFPGGKNFRSSNCSAGQTQISFRISKSISVQHGQRPNPAACIDCREMSAVEAMPCMRNLNSSAFEALSRAVS
jgi:hypothetical protein